MRGRDYPILATGIAASTAFAGTAQVWVASYHVSTISIFDGSGTPVRTLTGNGLSGPAGILYANQFVWVTNYSSNTLRLFDSLGTPLETLSGNGLNQPFGIALIGSQIWVTNHGNNTISRFDLTGGALGTLSGNGLTAPQAIAQVGTTAWIANASANTISIFSTSGTAIRTLYHASLNGPDGVAVVGATVWVSNYNANTLSVFSLSGSFLHTISAGSLNGPVGITPTGQTVWVANAGNSTISVYDVNGVPLSVLSGNGVSIPYLMGTIPTNAAPASVYGEHSLWVRGSQNPILSPTAAWEQTAIQEPTALVDGSSYVLYYTGGWTNAGMGIATCPLSSDPTVPTNWTKYAGNPVLGQGGGGVAGFVARNSVLKVGSTYYCYFSDAASGGNIKVATSTDGLTWAYQQAVLSGYSAANTQVWIEGATWYMLVETNQGPYWATYLATSSDGLSFSFPAQQPTGLQLIANGTYGGPWLTAQRQYNGVYELWYHATREAGNTPTNIYRATSTDKLTWSVWNSNIPALTCIGTGFEVDQVADPCVVEYAGNTYLFYSGVDNPYSTAHVGIASYPGTVAQLIS